MKNTTLAVMAAGMGSRFGKGIKQLTPVGPNGELLIDYSVYDAVSAGFNKVVFIIRRDLEKDFKEMIGDRIAKKVKVEYAFQELNGLPEGFSLPAGRVKPWGTGHAVLAAKEFLTEPFAVINADDYYGREPYEKLYAYLQNISPDEDVYDVCMAGFTLENTLSDNGTVTRGVCAVDNSGHLIDIDETRNIAKHDGQAVVEKDGDVIRTLDGGAPVSMNMWGFNQCILDKFGTMFVDFLKENIDKVTSEFLLPEMIGSMLKDGKASVSVLPTASKWFGMTYSEDTQIVKDMIKSLIDEGFYPENLM